MVANHIVHDLITSLTAQEARTLSSMYYKDVVIPQKCEMQRSCHRIIMLRTAVYLKLWKNRLLGMLKLSALLRVVLSKSIIC